MPRRLDAFSGALVVVASMIGMGVFSTTGFLAKDLASPWVIVTAWGLGGLAALCGALCYAELGAALPHNGGEYQLLTRIYHPGVGMIAAWNSLIVGFSAPLAAMGLNFGELLAPLFPQAPAESARFLASGLIVCCALFHSGQIRSGLRFHNLATLFKLLLIAGFIVAGLASARGGMWTEPTALPWWDGVRSAPFAVGLYYIFFSYSGWNSATYLAGEIRDPGRNVPRALWMGTLLVTVLYVLLNVVFLAAAPRELLAESGPRVAVVAAQALFGSRAAFGMTLLIACGLIATVSAMTISGPRVYEAAGRDYSRLSLLAFRSPERGPTFAILLQSILALIFVWLLNVRTLLEYISFTLSMFTALTATGVLVMRFREPHLPRPYRVWAFPLPPLFLAGLEVWMVAQTVRSRPLTVLAGLATLAVGLVIYLCVARSRRTLPTD